jgi:tRNA pseudouridine55 synthase
MATGVRVLAIGEATNLVPYLTSLEKSYDAEVTFGVGTDTLDAEGAAIAEGAVPADLEARLASALSEERARELQVPPAFSAIHTAGERAQAIARRGETVVLAPRPVRVIDLRLESIEPPRAALSLRVSKGYYVRSLARDLGERVGAPAHLSRLRRTAAGAFALRDAASLDDPQLDARLVPLDEAAARVLPRVELTERGELDARAGRVLRAEDRRSGDEVRGPSAWTNASGALIAIGTIDERGEGRVLRGIRDPARR